MHRSIFVKLLGIAIVVGTLINLIVFVAFRHPPGPPPPIRKHVDMAMEQYLGQFAKEIGDHPTQEKINSVSEDTGLEIRIDGPSGIMVSNEELRDIPSDKLRRKGHRPPPPIKGFHAFQVIESGANTYYFFGPPSLGFGIKTQTIVNVLLLVTAMLLIAVVSIRALLRPVKELSQGLASVGEGNLHQKLPVRYRDELGQLAEAFNNMSERLREMITAKEQLLIDVSHELRSPLARMKVAVELLKDESKKAHLTRDVNDMERMITDIMDAATVSAAPNTVSKSEQDVVALIQAVVTPYLDAGRRIECDLPSTQVLAQVDAGKVVMLMRNLIDNALKYSEGSTKPVEIGLSSHGSEVVLTVKDYGVGIDASELPKVFEPFYRVDKSRNKNTGGYGLGLSICKRITTAHEGRINVKSELNIGTTVTVTIPR